MIRQAQAEDLEEVRALFREYAAWVRDVNDIGEVICFGSFERELAALPGRYAPPGGALLIATIGEQLAGCAGLRRLTPDIGEMKRLYVRGGFRGRGTGCALVDAVIAEARAIGYESLRLDTLPRMESAIRMYRSLGFTPIPPYGDHPSGALCFELKINLAGEYR